MHWVYGKQCSLSWHILLYNIKITFINIIAHQKSMKDLRSYQTMGFPHSSAGKESTWYAGDWGSIPGSGRSPGKENGNSLQCSCLENPMDGGAWQATVHGVARVRQDLVTKSPPQVVGCMFSHILIFAWKLKFYHSLATNAINCFHWGERLTLLICEKVSARYQCPKSHSLSVMQSKGQEIFFFTASSRILLNDSGIFSSRRVLWCRIQWLLVSFGAPTVLPTIAPGPLMQLQHSRKDKSVLLACEQFCLSGPPISRSPGEPHITRWEPWPTVR